MATSSLAAPATKLCRWPLWGRKTRPYTLHPSGHPNPTPGQLQLNCPSYPEQGPSFTDPLQTDGMPPFCLRVRPLRWLHTLASGPHVAARLPTTPAGRCPGRARCLLPPIRQQNFSKIGTCKEKAAPACVVIPFEMATQRPLGEANPLLSWVSQRRQCSVAPYSSAALVREPTTPVNRLAEERADDTFPIHRPQPSHRRFPGRSITFHLLKPENAFDSSRVLTVFPIVWAEERANGTTMKGGAWAGRAKKKPRRQSGGSSPDYLTSAPSASPPSPDGR